MKVLVTKYFLTSIMYDLQFYITIAISLVIGLSSSVVPNENIKKMMAVIATLGVIYAVGTTVYWFLNILVLAVIMYFYQQKLMKKISAQI